MELRASPVIIFGCITDEPGRPRTHDGDPGGSAIRSEVSSCALETDVLVPKCRLGGSESVRVLEHFTHRGPTSPVTRELRVDDF